MPEGDDELVITFGEVMHRCFCVSMVSERGLIYDVSTVPTLPVRPRYPFMGRGFVDYSGRYLQRATLLVAGVIGVTLVMGSCQVGRLCHYYEFQAHRWSPHG